MQHLNTLTTSLTLTAGLMICGSAHAQGGLQQVPSGPTDKGFGKTLEQAENLIDNAIGILELRLLQDDHRPDDGLEDLLDDVDAWIRAAGTDLGVEGTNLVRRQLGRAGTNLLGRSADSVLTLADVGDFRAAVLDARVERALRRLARSASAGAWTRSEYTNVINVWSTRIDFEVERQRGRKASGVRQPDIVIDYGGPKFRAKKEHNRQVAGLAAPDKPDKIRGYGGPGKTFEKQRSPKAAGMDQPDIIIDYRGAGTSLARQGDRYATGVGQAELVTQLQEGLDYTLLHMRGKKGAGLEEVFLLVTEFRMKVALQRFKQQVDAGQNTTLHQLHMFDLALERQKQAALAGRPK